MHYIGRDRYVHYINSGNFFIGRAAFEAVGGFREDLRTDEDSDIGRRLTAAGHRLFECAQVKAVHFGNPASLSDHYRRTVWHSLGMFSSLRHGSIDRPTAMLVLHLTATVFGVVWIVFGPGPLLARIVCAAALQLLVPGVTILYRIVQTRRMPRPHHALLVYWVYYAARLHALSLIGLGRGRDYRR
jgi:hypothetical protein